MRVFKILVIDDEPDIISYFNDIEEILSFEKLEIEFEYLHNVENFKIENPYDILMFDCNFNGARFNEEARNQVGFNLIKEYRKYNKRTKVIFYSSSFNIEEAHLIPFSHRQYFDIINNLNVYKLIYKNDSKSTCDAIRDSINDLDIIMTSLEKMVVDYDELNLKFEVNGSELTIGQLIREMKMDGENAKKFREEVVELITNYMTKFDLNDVN